MKRTALTLITATLLIATQAPAVFLDTFDTLSSEWEFTTGESGIPLIYDVTGGVFNAYGFGSGSSAVNHGTRMRRQLFGEGSAGFQNLRMDVELDLPLTDQVFQVGFGLEDTGSSGLLNSRRFFLLDYSAGVYQVALVNGSQFQVSQYAPPSETLLISILNEGPVSRLMINGNEVMSVVSSGSTVQNPTYDFAMLSFTGRAGIGPPVSIEFVQVVPEPVSLSGLGIATLLIMRKSFAGSSR